MPKLLTIDFESKDPYIGRKLGSGWVYNLLYPEDNDFKILGASLKVDSEPTFWSEDFDEIKHYVDKSQFLVMHSSQYDLGCLHAIGAKVKDKPIFDTIVMAKLIGFHDSYELDDLGRQYVGEGKLKNSMVDQAIAAQLVPKRNMKLPKKWVMSNLDIIKENLPGVVEEYGIQDTDLTYKLFKVLLSKQYDKKLAFKYSMVEHILIHYRINGLRVDLDRAREVREIMNDMCIKLYAEIQDDIGLGEINTKGKYDKIKICEKLGLKFGYTKKGNPSITKDFWAKQNHPICKKIVEYDSLVKYKTDYIEKIIEAQQYSCPPAFYNNERYGRIHPTLRLFGAKTGRFSCTNPPIQQIPKHSKMAPLCRSIYVPEEGHKMYAADYSAQEIRIGIHFACQYKCKGWKDIKEAYLKNPSLDQHTECANRMGLQERFQIDAKLARKRAKALNLGILYGKGIGSLAIELGVSDMQSKELRDLHKEKTPYFSHFSELCKKEYHRQKYTTTIEGRRVFVSPPTRKEDGDLQDYGYRHINYRIQGSAMEQTLSAMRLAYNHGLRVLMPMHDELILSGTEEDVKLLVSFMINAKKLDIPVKVDYNNIGADNWADCYKGE